MHLKTSAPEVKVLLKWWRVIRSTSSEAKSLEAGVHQKMRDLKLQMDLKALDACSLKSVDKVQVYEVYNHYIHYT